MKKFIINCLISFVVIFCLLTGGTASLLASYYLWITTVLTGLLCLFLFFAIVAIKTTDFNLRTNFTGYTDSQLFILHPFTRLCNFSISMMIAFIAYKVGYETLSIYYGIAAVLAQVLVSVWIGILKGR